jgi:large subunit ribosomal protein L6
MRALVGNMLTGVTQGFSRQLEINGVGYKAEIKGAKIVLSLGFSHPIEYQLPEGITAKVDKNLLILSGIDRQQLGAATAEIRSFRPPEPYKGKGIKYVEETILRKAGKTAGK